MISHNYYCQMVMDKTVELPKPQKKKKNQKKGSQLINKGVGNPIERERLVAKKWGTEHVLKYKL